MRYYRVTTGRRRWPWRLAGGVWLLIAVLAAAFWGADRYAERILAKVSPDTPQVREARAALTPSTGDDTTFLVLGSSRRPSQAPWLGNSDTMILVHLDRHRQLISMMSVPRDLKVQMPGYTAPQKIDAALSEGGPRLSIRVVQQVLGVPVNHYVLVFWQGFFQVVQRVHGVYEQIDRRYYNPEGDSWTPIDLHPGYQLLNGNQALEYVRFRHLDTDIVRSARQQRFLLDFRRQASQQIGVTDIPSVLDTLGGSLQTDVHSVGTVIDLAGFMLGLPKGRIYHTTLDVSLGRSFVYASPAQIQRSVQRFMDPPAALTAPGAASVSPRSVPLVVENAGGGLLAADRVAVALRARGLDAVSAGEAPAGVPSTTEVYYAANAAPQAAAISSALGGLAAQPAPASLAGSPVTLVVGPGFALRRAAPVRHPRHPRHRAAPVRLVRDAAPARAAAGLGSTGLRLEVPTVVTPASRLAVTEGVRAYRIAPRGGGGGWPAVVFSFQDGPSGLGRFWDVQETTMPNPPLVDEATRTVTHGSRSYRLVEDGSGVRAVAFREGNVWIWVSNTLDNHLSPAQMVGIAEGVRAARG